jgi:rod shape-determining protein MreC
MSRRPRTKSGKRPARRLFYGVLLALAVALLIVQSAPGIAAYFAPARTTAGDIIVGGGQVAGSQGPGLIAHLTGQADNEKRIRELEAKVRELSRYELAARSMAQRLEAYEAMLNALGEPPRKGVTARIVAEPAGPFFKTLLANAGRAQGVRIDYVAVNEGGLVGRVIEVGETSSRILMVSDYNSRIPVLGETSGVRAILFGDRDGAAGLLDDRPERDPFLTGERALTSGEGGVFPRGLTVGEVYAGEDKAGQTVWRVRFSMAETRGGFVRLIPPARIPTPADSPAPEEDRLAGTIVGDTAIAPESDETAVQ